MVSVAVNQEEEDLRKRREAYLFSENADIYDLVALCPEEYQFGSSWYTFAEQLSVYAGRVFWKGDGTENELECYMRTNQVRCLRAIFASRLSPQDKLSVAAWMLSVMCGKVPILGDPDIWLLRKVK